MIMVEMEEPKTVLKDQRKQISAGFRDELNKRHIGVNAFKASGILEEVTKVHERTLKSLGIGQHQHRNNESFLEGYYTLALLLTNRISRKRAELREDLELIH